MKVFYRLASSFFLIILLFSLFSCAPFEIQGSFNASFSLTECLETDDQYQYEFYGNGQGLERNTKNGVCISFTYTALNDSLTVSTENVSFTYEYKIEEEKDLNLTYRKNGKTETVLLVKK